MLLKAPLNKENNVEVRCNLLILDQILFFCFRFSSTAGGVMRTNPNYSSSGNYINF